MLTAAQSEIAARGVRGELGDGRVTDPARRVVDDPPEGHLVLRVEDELEVRDEVLHLFALVELLPADHPDRDLPLLQRALDQRRLAVGSVEHGHVLGPRVLALEEALDLVADEARLDVGIDGDDHLHEVALHPRRAQDLAVAARCRLRQHRVGHVEDGLARSVVLLELHHLGAGEMSLEIEDVAHVGAAPRVDGLVVVADDAHVLVLPAEEPHQLELRVVGVLVLVDDHVAKALAPALEHVGPVPPEVHDLADQIVEVEGLERAQRRLVARVDPHRDLVVVVDALALALPILPLLHAQERVLGVGDPREERADVVVLSGAQLAQDLLDHPRAVGLIEDRERRAAQPERARLQPEHREAEAMERGDLEVFRDLGADEAHHALAHLGGGLVGERHRQDRSRGDAALDQLGDALGDDARLAGARACEHEHGPVVVLDGGRLRRIEANGHEPG